PVLRNPVTPLAHLRGPVRQLHPVHELRSRRSGHEHHCHGQRPRRARLIGTDPWGVKATHGSPFYRKAASIRASASSLPSSSSVSPIGGLTVEPVTATRMGWAPLPMPTPADSDSPFSTGAIPPAAPRRTRARAPPGLPGRPLPAPSRGFAAPLWALS